MKEPADRTLRLLLEDEQATRTERLYERMKYMILSGMLPAGYTFPNENEVCQALQIGRGTLREAYRSLLSDNLIKRSKTGTVVNSKMDIIRNAPFTVASHYAKFEEVFEFRLMLESEDARSAAKHATEEELQQIGDIVKAHAATTDVDERQDLDMKFHESIATFSHNPLLINVFTVVHGSFESLLASNYRNLRVHSPQTLSDAVVHHKLVYDALHNRDSDTAYKAMREHLLNVYAGTLPPEFRA